MSENQIDVTEFIHAETMRDYSASVAEIGKDAGRITWDNATSAADKWMLLDTSEKRDAFRAWTRESGDWTDEEVAAWCDVDLNALFLQWVANDVRACDLDQGATWEEIEARQASGHAPSNLWCDDAGRVFFSLEL